MNPKAVFLKDKENAAWWVSVVHDPRFERVAVFATACMAQRARNKDHLDGAGDMIGVLKDLVEPEAAEVPFPTPGIIHETPGRTPFKPDQKS